MKITLSDAGKRFNREWIFRHFSYIFTTSNAYAITGANGSGKSTLLQFVAAALMPTEGTIQYSKDDKPVEEIYKHLSIVAPYLETIEEMTATEFLQFHEKFKPFITESSIPEILSRVGLTDSADKQIRYYSSGMKQRLKLAQAVFSKTEVLLMDEPTTNLDAGGIALYHDLIRNYTNGRLVIVSSNDQMEYSFCNNIIEMNSLKGYVPNPPI